MESCRKGSRLEQKVGKLQKIKKKSVQKTWKVLEKYYGLHDATRRDMWPEPTLLRDKLYGNLEELRRTAAFLRTTDISI